MRRASRNSRCAHLWAGLGVSRAPRNGCANVRSAVPLALLTRRLMRHWRTTDAHWVSPFLWLKAGLAERNLFVSWRPSAIQHYVGSDSLPLYLDALATGGTTKTSWCASHCRCSQHRQRSLEHRRASQAIVMFYTLGSTQKNSTIWYVSRPMDQRARASLGLPLLCLSSPKSS